MTYIGMNQDVEGKGTDQLPSPRKIREMAEQLGFLKPVRFNTMNDGTRAELRDVLKRALLRIESRGFMHDPDVVIACSFIDDLASQL